MRINRHFSVAGFSLLLAVIVAIIAVYSVNEHRRLRARIEQSLVGEGLAIIASFEASVCAGLAGPRQMSHDRLLETMRDTCRRAEVDYVWLATPTRVTSCVTRTGYMPPLEPTLSNLRQRLDTAAYTWCYEDIGGGRVCVSVSRPLQLDYESGAGIRTFRLYRLLNTGTNDSSHVRELAPERHRVRSLPIMTVAVPANDVRALGRETVVRSLSLGMVVLLLGATLAYVAVVIQQHRSVAEALADMRAENEKLVRRLRRADQLALIDRMAATMAHELRNSLGAIRMFAQLSAGPPVPGEEQEMRANADLVVKEIDRINTLISTVLGLSRPAEAVFARCAVGDIVRNIMQLVRYDVAARKIETVAQLDPALPEIDADAQLLAQMLMNLVANACDAMPGGGTLTIAASHGDGRVVLTVRDTGTGIAKEHMAQVFEPFFTTKASGTGLGLAVVESIVARHGGSVSVESAPGTGSSFIIELPVTQGEQA